MQHTLGFFLGDIGGIDWLQLETLMRTIHLMNAEVFLPQDATILFNVDPYVSIDMSILEHTLRTHAAQHELALYNMS